MNFCVVVFAVAVACSGGPGAEVAEDAWLAEDKLQHFTMSFAATHMAYGAASVVLQPDPATAAAATAAIGLGVAKELRDLRHGGPFSVRDLVWDAAGVALGIALVRQIR